MTSPIIGFNSYVDIAICMVIEQSDYQKLRQCVAERCGNEGTTESLLDLTDADFEASVPDLLKVEWTNRIKEWQRLYSDNGPRVEEWTSLKEFIFGAFFLQHPISAMSLWNVMQTFYALDHFVCSTSKESREKVAQWGMMPQFEYLEASKVEKRWRSSLQSLRKDIENDNSKDVLLPRINDMLFGVSKLEDACGELQRSLRANLTGVKLMDPILKQISIAAGRRFSMIETYLNIDENRFVGGNDDDATKGAIVSVDSIHDLNFEKQKIPTPKELRLFKPLSRTNSIDVIKNHFSIAWISTKKGEATLSAVVILLILLICLHQLQEYLDILPES